MSDLYLSMRAPALFLGVLLSFLACDGSTPTWDHESEEEVNAEEEANDVDRPPCASASEHPENAGGAAGSSGSSDNDTQNDDWSQLTGSYYLLDHTAPYLALGVQPVIEFRGSQLLWDVCNLSSGDYAIEDGVLVMGTISSDLAQCEPHGDHWSHFLVATLTSRPAISWEGENIVLTTAYDRLVFAPGEPPESTLPTAPLEETEWQVVLLSGSMTQWHCYTPEPGFMGTLLFEAPAVDAPGVVNVTGPCSTASGSYEVDDQVISLNSMTWTKQACPDDDAERRQEILSGLFAAGTVSYQILEQTLRLETFEDPSNDFYLQARVMPVR